MRQLSLDRRRFLKHVGGLCGAFPVAFSAFQDQGRKVRRIGFIGITPSLIEGFGAHVLERILMGASPGDYVADDHFAGRYCPFRDIDRGSYRLCSRTVSERLTERTCLRA